MVLGNGPRTSRVRPGGDADDAQAAGSAGGGEQKGDDPRFGDGQQDQGEVQELRGSSCESREGVDSEGRRKGDTEGIT